MLKTIKKLLSRFSPGSENNDTILLQVKDESCGNEIPVRVIKSHDLHRIYEDELPGNYRLKKVVICDECFNKIWLEVYFDSSYSIVSREAEGGKIINFG